MKFRFFALLILIALLVSCGAPATTTDATATDTTTDTTTGGAAVEDTPTVYEEKTALELLELMRPTVEAEKLTVYIDPLNLKDKDAFQYHFFVNDDKNIVEAAKCEPTNGVTPFFLGILKTSSAKAAETLADEIYDNIDYCKLICTTFEKAYTRAIGDTVILIMDGDAARCDRMLAAFEALADQS